MSGVNLLIKYYPSGIGVGPGKRKSSDYVMELTNKILSLMIGQSFTADSVNTTANAISFLNTMKKNVENQIRGK